MIGHPLKRRSVGAAASALALLACSPASAQIAYGVNSDGLLFRFDVATPSVVSEIGFLPFVPEGIDFRPSTATLYAIDIGPNTTQLYTVDLATAAPTAVGAGFSSSGVNPGAYDLTGNQTFGFDFNPTTLQADNSMRIRLVSSSGENLRLNSSTGQIAAVDGDLIIPPEASPFVDAAAYTNNVASMGGTTALYDLDSRNDDLFLQNPPNAGTLVTVGPFGVTIDAQPNMGFDILTLNGADIPLAVFTRPDAPTGGVAPLGSYLLYDVNLATGATTNGRLVGPADNPYDFSGGFALVAIPEPQTAALAALGVLGAFRRR